MQILQEQISVHAVVRVFVVKNVFSVIRIILSQSPERGNYQELRVLRAFVVNQKLLNIFVD